MPIPVSPVFVIIIELARPAVLNVNPPEASLENLKILAVFWMKLVLAPAEVYQE